ncbi:MAG TPA: OmpW family outer membrane protein [Thermoanaerobaculia bacterium]|jgi:outer membrane protein W|nr:OmpW family outer membrane protein [Thermoanaerobaculia bacterium]
MKWAAAILIASFGMPLCAQSNDFGLWLAGSRLGTTTEADGRVKFDNGRGWGMSLNRFWTSQISTELSWTTTSSDGRVDFAGGESLNLGSLDLQAAALVGQWHFARNARISPYLGGGVAHISADDLTSDDLRNAGVAAVSIDDEWAWCANAGVNVSVTKQLSLTVDAKYSRYEPDSAAAGDVEPVKLKLNPVVIAVGMRARF